jgi:hypothetical protein
MLSKIAVTRTPTSFRPCRTLSACISPAPEPSGAIYSRYRGVRLSPSIDRSNPSPSLCTLARASRPRPGDHYRNLARVVGALIEILVAHRGAYFRCVACTRMGGSMGQIEILSRKPHKSSR